MRCYGTHAVAEMCEVSDSHVRNLADQLGIARRYSPGFRRMRMFTTPEAETIVFRLAPLTAERRALAPMWGPPPDGAGWEAEELGDVRRRLSPRELERYAMLCPADSDTGVLAEIRAAMTMR